MDGQTTRPQLPTTPEKNLYIVTPLKGIGGKYKKILAAIVIIILVVILAEVVYFLSKRSESLFAPPPTQENRPILINPSPTPEINTRGNQIVIEKLDDFLANIVPLNRGYLNDASISYTLSGNLTDIRSGENSKNNITYALGLQIREGDRIPVTLWFTEQDISNASFYLISEGKTEKTDREVFKIGDTISITTILNLLDTSTASQVIFKLSRQEELIP